MAQGSSKPVDVKNMWKEGGFDVMSREHQEHCRAAHAEWQAKDPEKHKSDVRSYCRFVQAQSGVRFNNWLAAKQAKRLGQG